MQIHKAKIKISHAFMEAIAAELAQEECLWLFDRGKTMEKQKRMNSKSEFLKQGSKWRHRLWSHHLECLLCTMQQWLWLNPYGAVVHGPNTWETYTRTPGSWLQPSAAPACRQHLGGEPYMGKCSLSLSLSHWFRFMLSLLSLLPSLLPLLVK